MKRLLLAVALLLLAATPAHATPFNGSVLVTCNLASSSQNDPIVSWGVFPSSHPHAFWGSDQAGASTTLPQMLAGGTSCDVKSDKSLYWHPMGVSATGQPVLPGRSSFYYRAANRGPNHTFPLGLRFVYGDHSNLSSLRAAARWSCGGVTQSVIPASCPPGEGVQETIYVASCWDGRNLGAGGGGQDNITGSANMAGAPGNPPVCPADHPVVVPSLQFIINWPAALAGGRLSSDEIGADPGASAHVDFFNAWTLNSQSHDALSLIVDQCLNIDAVAGAVTCRPNAAGVVNRTSDGSYVTD